MRKGSITLFALLSMILVVSTLFTFLEATRFYQLKTLSQLQSKVALESVFAEYNTYLWEDYRILACKQDTVLEKVELYANQQIVESYEGVNFFQFQVKAAEWNGYTRLTDYDGVAFIQAAAGYMENNILAEVLQNISRQYETLERIWDENEYAFEDIDQVLEVLNESDTTRNVARTRIVTTDNNPLEVIQNLQRKGILSLVLKEDVSVSEKEFQGADRVSTRILPEENSSSMEEVDLYSRILFQQYILTYFSNYQNDTRHAFDYEVEYLLIGKDSEIDNLKGAVNQIMAIRTASNFLHLSNSVLKKEQAGMLAATIAGISGNPVLTEGVKIAILTAWAFAESILDLRTLLAGGKISLLKNDSDWTLDLEDITKLEEEFPMANDCIDGLAYKDYLGMLLLLQRDETSAMRAMDVQEETLRERYADDTICMEDWIVEANVTVTYGYQPVFFSIREVVPSWKYEMCITEKMAY